MKKLRVTSVTVQSHCRFIERALSSYNIRIPSEQVQYGVCIRPYVFCEGLATPDYTDTLHLSSKCMYMGQVTTLQSIRPWSSFMGPTNPDKTILADQWQKWNGLMLWNNTAMAYGDADVMNHDLGVT